MAVERTFSILKPDATRRNLTGKINAKFEEAGLRIGYMNYDGNYEVALFGRNITDEDNVKGAIDFNNNTGFVNEPRIIGVEFKKNFF